MRQPGVYPYTLETPVDPAEIAVTELQQGMAAVALAAQTVDSMELGIALVDAALETAEELAGEALRDEMLDNLIDGVRVDPRYIQQLEAQYPGATTYMYGKVALKLNEANQRLAEESAKPTGFFARVFRSS